MTETEPKKMKVFVMGKLVEETELPPLEPPAEYHFAPVVLSKRAIDAASQIIPETMWKPYGLYTWLEQRANVAFSKLAVGQYEITGGYQEFGKLKYVFEPKNDVPHLKNVVRV